MVRRVSEALIACNSARDVEPFLKMTAIAHHQKFALLFLFFVASGWYAMGGFSFFSRKKKLLEATNSTGQLIVPKSAAKW